jgi:hypothetical protein
MSAVDALPRLLIVYVHLIATCVALGALLSTDARLLGRIAHVDFRLAPPNALVMRLVAVALFVTVATGAMLVIDTPAGQRPALSNPKVQAKLVLVGLLVVNAFVLHMVTFPRLARGRRISPWRARWAFGVALPLAMSHALWLFVAFLGIARPWNHTVTAPFVLAVAAGLVVVCWAATLGVVVVAAHRQRTRRARSVARTGQAQPSALAVTGPVPLQATMQPAPFEPTLDPSPLLGDIRPDRTIAAG